MSRSDKIHIKAGKLQGAHLYLDTPSHTGTENLIMAACLAPGTTIIDNALSSRKCSTSSRS